MLRHARKSLPPVRSSAPVRRPSGHVYRVGGKRGAVWYAKYRLPDGRQFKRKAGPAWQERGRPAAGYFTRGLAEDWLRETLEEARRGTLVGLVRTGATFADAAAEFLRYTEHDRGRKPSTLRGYRSAVEAHLVPAFGRLAVESLTTDSIERWIATVEGSPRTRNKLLIILHGVVGRAQKVYRLPLNAAASIEKFLEDRHSDIQASPPTRSARSSAPRPASRTPRSTSPPRSRACAWAS